jgi:hypothetical protein
MSLETGFFMTDEAGVPGGRSAAFSAHLPQSGKEPK